MFCISMFLVTQKANEEAVKHQCHGWTTMNLDLCFNYDFAPVGLLDLFIG